MLLSLLLFLDARFSERERVAAVAVFNFGKASDLFLGVDLRLCRFAFVRKTMKYMAEQGLIATEVDRSTGKKQYSVRKWFDNRTSRFVEFYIGKIAESFPPVLASCS